MKPIRLFTPKHHSLGPGMRPHLASAHGQCGECVLEDLLEAQELDHTQGHGGVEAQASLVGANGTAELRAQTHIHRVRSSRGQRSKGMILSAS